MLRVDDRPLKVKELSAVVEADLNTPAQLTIFHLLGAANNPYRVATTDQRAVLQPVIERYVRGQIGQDWGGLIVCAPPWRSCWS